MHRPTASSARNIIVAVAGGLTFVASLLIFVWYYAVGWDADVAGPPLRSAIVDVLLFSAFALHHSLFARSGLKRWISSVVPPELERSTYVWIASVLLIVVTVAWVPVPGVAWHVTGWPGRVMSLIQAVAAVTTVLAARRLGTLRLAGVTQVLEQPADATSGALYMRGLYAIVRHPIYTAWVVVVWATPHMNGTRLVFAAISTLYLVVAVPFEERDLRRAFRDYATYATRVRWRMLPFVY
jgi:methanethiol S-methyltransferase